MVPSNALREELEVCVKQAGELVMHYFGKEHSIKEKYKQGFVTEADVAVENFLIPRLLAMLPEASIWAEESGKSHQEQADYCWVIDPIDGTTNFARGLPYFCTSIALTYQGKPELGVIYQPITDEFFFAQRSQGAFLNGKPIKVSKPSDFGHSLIAFGLPYAKGAQFMHSLESVQRVGPKTYTIRQLGAVALDLAYVACGKLDGLFFEGLSWWDVAAGQLLVQEAGGLATDFMGNSIGSDYRSCIAAEKTIYCELYSFVQ